MRKCGKKLWKKLWGKRGITRKWRKKWEEIKEKLWWKFHCIYKSFLSTASICRPTEDSVSTLLPVELDVCKDIHWGWQVSATCLIFILLYILPVVRKQLKHFHNKWFRNTSSILPLAREVSVWIIYKYAQSFTRVYKSFFLIGQQFRTVCTAYEYQMCFEALKSITPLLKLHPLLVLWVTVGFLHLQRTKID